MSLSKRGQEAADMSKGLLIWEIIPNLWHPDRNPDGFLSLGVAENSLMHETLSKHIHDKITLPNEGFTYGDGPSGSKRMKRTIASFLTKHLKSVTPIEPLHVSVTNGCSSAIEHLSWAFANPGDGFLLGQPYYGTFIPDITLRFGTKLVSVPFHDVDPIGEDCVKKYEETLLEAQSKGQKMTGLVLSNPHNPLGRCYSRDTLIGLMKLCEKHDMHLISDEIYAFSVFENTIDTNPAPVPFTSALAIDTTDIMNPARLHVIWGMSKDFGANGIRVGSVISQHNPDLMMAMTSVGLYSSVSSLSEHVTCNILEDSAWNEAYMAENKQKLGKQYQTVVEWAKRNGIEYSPGVNAAFFLWVNLGKVYQSKNPSVKNVDKAVVDALLAKKVFLASGTDFGSEKPGWFRIVFSHEDDFLFQGLTRVEAALGLDVLN